MPAVPVGSVNLRVAGEARGDHAGTVGIRLARLGTSEPILAEGSARAPSHATPDWVDITLLHSSTRPRANRWH